MEEQKKKKKNCNYKEILENFLVTHTTRFSSPSSGSRPPLDINLPSTPFIDCTHIPLYEKMDINGGGMARLSCFRKLRSALLDGDTLDIDPQSLWKLAEFMENMDVRSELAGWMDKQIIIPVPWEKELVSITPAECGALAVRSSKLIEERAFDKEKRSPNYATFCAFLDKKQNLSLQALLTRFVFVAAPKTEEREMTKKKRAFMFDADPFKYVLREAVRDGYIAVAVKRYEKAQNVILKNIRSGSQAPAAIRKLSDKIRRRVAEVLVRRIVRNVPDIFESERMQKKLAEAVVHYLEKKSPEGLRHEIKGEVWRYVFDTVKKEAYYAAAKRERKE